MSAALLGIIAVMLLPIIGLCVTTYLSVTSSRGDDNE